MTKINSHVKNSRVSIFGKDILIDYEFSKHCYHNEEGMRNRGVVPVEMYPYFGDVLVGEIHVDDKFGVIDLQELYTWAITSIAEEKSLE